MKQPGNLAGLLRGGDRARIDLATAALLGAATELQTWLARAAHHRPQAAAAGLVLWGAVATRRRWPLAAVLAGCGAVSFDAAFGGFLTALVPASFVAGILCFYGGGAFLASRRAWWALAAGLLLLLPQVLLTPHVVSNLLFEPVVLAFAPWLCGRWMRDRSQQAFRLRELSEQLDVERERRITAAGELERIRIARELHDVIGHCLSVVVLQAGGARLLVDSQPERARDAMRVVERAGHEALAEVGHLLGVFGDDRAASGFQPQPGIENIDELVLRTRGVGVETELLVDGEPAEVSPALALCAYRIVQESLTNTIKHARAERATVRVRWQQDRLELEIADDGRGPVGPALRHDGHGIVGMRERAAVHNGSIEVGPADNGGYQVRALLPLIEDGAA